MNKTDQYRPVIYFALAFAITWINGFFLVVQSHHDGDKSIINLMLAYMGPLIAALIMMYVFADGAFRADFRRRIYDIRLINKNYLPFVLFFLPLAMVISILISIAFGQPAEQLRVAEELKVFEGEAILSMIILALVPVLEELGWRGYGVDSLASRFNLFNASIIFGILWAIWHLPVFFIKGSYQLSLWEQNPLFAINFFVGILPLAIIMNYLYYMNQRSIILLALFHVIVNFSSELFEANQISKCILTLVLIVAAAAIVVRNRRFFFVDKMNLEITGSSRRGPTANDNERLT
ncbi:MAG TPA: CPBP family intramembrane metalloprotease [Methanothrix sp.]|nr:CPBP family intramembrane metalloprotease [Methanothrix soehngenii]HRW81949.1 CPBP family intramembrane metalloprotease [Methanothrix sp.]